MRGTDVDPGPLAGILEALVEQKEALLLQTRDSEVFDKSVAANLDMVMRSIERTKAAIDAQVDGDASISEISIAQMREFLKAMDQRIEERVRQRMDSLVEEAALRMCCRCADAVRRIADAQQPAATTQP